MTEELQKSGTKHKTNAGKTATLLACIFWILSIILSFTITPRSALMWIADATLLIGFMPLLFIWKPSWTWIGFGLCNFGIGFFMLIIEFLQAKDFPVSMHSQFLLGKQHMEDFHHPWTWMIIGVLCTIYGCIRLVKNLVLFLINKRKG